MITTTYNIVLATACLALSAAILKKVSITISKDGEIKVSVGEEKQKEETIGQND
jgi:hypothetical protein